MTKDRNMGKDQIKQVYRVRQSRQIIAIAMSLFLVLLLAVVYKRPDIFGTYAKKTLFAAQTVVIGAFCGFTAQNWRCPSCRSFLAGDMSRRRCRRCGAHLQ